MTIALQVFVSGLAAGGVYGLFAAGHTLIYRLTGMVNFAFGDLVGLGVFATLLVLAGTAPVTQSGAHEPRFLGALVVTVMRRQFETDRPTAIDLGRRAADAVGFHYFDEAMKFLSTWRPQRLTRTPGLTAYSRRTSSARSA